MSYSNAHYYKKRAEAWAIGKQEGTAVSSSDETYNNNAKYWKEESEDWAVGTRAGVEDETHTLNNAKYWSTYSEQYAKGTKQGDPVYPGEHGYQNNAFYYSGIS